MIVVEFMMTSTDARFVCRDKTKKTSDLYTMSHFLGKEMPKLKSSHFKKPLCVKQSDTGAGVLTLFMNWRKKQL